MVWQVPKWLTYDFPTAVKAKVNRLWGGEWHGNAQKWFVSPFPFPLSFIESYAIEIGWPLALLEESRVGLKLLGLVFDIISWF